METPHDNNDHYRMGLFYYNPGDSRILVPKRYGIGWTFNFANFWSYVVVIAIIGLCAGSSIWAAMQRK